MAYVTDFFSAEHRSVKERFAALRASFARAMRQRQVYRQTYAELNSLNDRELADLGISASEIPFIARDAANTVA